MEALTKSNRKRQLSSNISEPCKPTKSVKSQQPEFVPDLYKAQNSKKIRASLPDANDINPNDLPCDTEAALIHIRNIYPRNLFTGKLPPIILFSQLAAVIKNRFLIETQLKNLVKQNKILTFSTFTTSNYLIVFLDDFAKLPREGMFHRFVNDVLTPKTCSKNEEDSSQSSPSKCSFQTSSENSKLFSKESLRKRWKFEEDEIRKLVNSGYLGVQEGGYYCMSLPGAGDFTKAYQKGKKTVLSAIKKSKFSEVLQKDLEQRPMKKNAILGVLYHIYDLIGSGEIDKLYLVAVSVAVSSIYPFIITFLPFPTLVPRAKPGYGLVLTNTLSLLYVKSLYTPIYRKTKSSIKTKKSTVFAEAEGRYYFRAFATHQKELKRQ